MSDIFDRFFAVCLEETAGDNGCKYGRKNIIWNPSIYSEIL